LADIILTDRDIKPENLLFEPIPFIPSKNPVPRGSEEEDKADEGEFIPGVGSGGIGRVKIADFGLSKIVWDSQTMTPCGTVGYTAPEIVKDERYSKSVDMWALGCVLYTLLCGFPPFYDESIQVLTEKVAKGQYTFLSPWWDDISKSAQDLVSHLLTVDPEKRYTIKEFMNHPWIRETDEETTAAADAPPLATPAYQREGQLGVSPLDKVSGFTPLPAHILDIPGRPMDFRSPGAINLREVFDVGYAVHRQEEEAKRRKNFGQGYRGGAGGMASLNALDEDDDDDYDGVDYGNVPPPPQAKLPKSRDADVHQVEQSLKQTNLGNPSAAAQARQVAAMSQSQQRGYGQHSAAVAAAAKQQTRRNPGAFELSLNNATLLGRRGKRDHPNPSKLMEQVAS
jgi:serine/threonine-protein kinase RCK2